LVPSSPGPSSSSLDTTGPLGRVGALLNIARSRTSVAPSTPVATQPDYLALPEDSDDEGMFFTVDTTPTPLIPTPLPASPPRLCPPHLDEMLLIVRTLRRDRAALVTGTSVVTPGSSERRSYEDNSNNFTKTNLTDFLHN